MANKRKPQTLIFSKGDDHTFADMGRTRGRQHVYAESYLYGGDLLAQHVADTNFDQDLLVYPIALLYRHHIELQLKNIINTGACLVDEKRDILTHNLQELWRWAKPIIRVAESTPDPNEFAELNKLVADFSTIDKQGDAFRFPEHTNGNPTLAGLEYMNIGELSRAVHRLGRFLGGCWEVVNRHVEFDDAQIAADQIEE